MHEHNECEHDLKFCKKCNVVYCTKCKREWNDHVPPIYSSYIPWYEPYKITYGVGTPNPLFESPATCFSHTDCIT